MFASGLGARFGSFTATRQSVNQLWDFITFVANSLLFLLVGLAINLNELRATIAPALWGIVAIALARIVSVYGLGALSAGLGRKLPIRWQHVFVLGGMRGALSMALVLSLPAAVAQRDLLVAMVFSAVLFTIVVQGLAIKPILRRLQLHAEPGGH